MQNKQSALYDLGQGGSDNGAQVQTDCDVGRLAPDEVQMGRQFAAHIGQAKHFLERDLVLREFDAGIEGNLVPAPARSPCPALCRR